jgi:lysine/ornithine N-monooxygenase
VIWVLKGNQEDETRSPKGLGAIAEYLTAAGARRLRHLPLPDKAQPAVYVQANTEVLEARDEPAGVSVKARIVSTGNTDVAVYDTVILCTGLDDETILESSAIGPELRRRLQKKQDRDGYAVTWDGPPDRMIFVQSQNKDTHGLGDASFVTAAGSGGMRPS